MNDPHKIDYDVVYLAVRNLSVIWREAQRPYDPLWSKSIADNFDPDKFEPVSVTKPNGAGVYHIIEGQHRTKAVEMLWGPSEQIPCRVIAEADPARAAELWLGINKGRKKTRPVRDFMVAVTAGLKLETSIDLIVRQKGYHVSDRSGENCIQAVHALRKVYLLSDRTLASTLDACRMLWGSDPHALVGSILTGMGLFLNEYQDYVDAKRLRAAIVDKYKSPWRFIEAATAERDKTSETMDHSMSELIRLQYNKGIKDPSRRLKRKES